MYAKCCWHPAFECCDNLPESFTIFNNINLWCNRWLMAYCWSGSTRSSITCNEIKKGRRKIWKITESWNQTVQMWNVQCEMCINLNWILWISINLKMHFLSLLYSIYYYNPIFSAFPSSFSSPLQIFDWHVRCVLQTICLFCDSVRWYFNLQFCSFFSFFLFASCIEMYYVFS